MLYKGNYFIRMAIMGVWTALLTIVFFFIMVLFWGSTATMIYARLLSWVSLKVFRVRLDISGKENLPQVPSILMVNHQSNLDPYLMGMIYPKDTIIIEKKKCSKFLCLE